MNQMRAAKILAPAVGLALALLVVGALAPVAGAAMSPGVAAPATAENIGFPRPVLAAPHVMDFSIIKTVLLILFAAGVFYVVNWSFLDVRFVQTRPPTWNSVVLGGAVAGLASAVLVPIFAIGLPLGIVIFAGAALSYAKHRNTLVTPPLMVLTDAHWKRAKARARGERPAADSLSGPITGIGRDIIFMGMDDMPIRPDMHSPAERQALAELERVMHDAIVRRASAVGYLARPHGGEVRFRIGGEMVGGGDVAKPAADAFASIFKRVAGLDPAEIRKPQEGRRRAVVNNQTFELRIKTSGTVKGEQIAVRIIDVAASQMRLDEIGLSSQHLAALKQALGTKPGLVILSSPKDAGLTTTLHACLRVFDRYVNNVIAFEPHVEVEVENVQHILVNQDDGPTAAAEVRSRVRMEPDIIAFDSLFLPEAAQVLGEALKERTIVISLRAADTSEALTKAIALFGSVAPLAEHLQIIVNQRVVRTLCPECREGYRPNPEFLRKANLASGNVDVLYRPRSRTELDKNGQPIVCPHCHNERYVGRMGLFEVMPVDAEVRDMIAHQAGIQDIRVHARKEGMRNLQEEGLQLVIDGRTSIEEVQRAIKQNA
jgi:general secretion pathway protein E